MQPENQGYGFSPRWISLIYALYRQTKPFWIPPCAGIMTKPGDPDQVLQIAGIKYPQTTRAISNQAHPAYRTGQIFCRPET
jgi:hypothetical protein